MRPWKRSQPAPPAPVEPAGPQPGEHWDGPVAYCTDAPADVPVHGFYALNDDGKGYRQPFLRLTYVDDAPGDPDDGAGHYEVAGPKDPPQKPGERKVELEAHAEGRTEASA